SGSTGNAYHVDDGHTQLLLECGISFKEIRKALNFNTNNLAGELITHEHKDHSKGLKDVTRAGIDCYMSAGTAEEIGFEHHRIKSIEKEKQFNLGTWDVQAFGTQHDAADPVGYFLQNNIGERLVF